MKVVKKYQFPVVREISSGDVLYSMVTIVKKKHSKIFLFWRVWWEIKSPALDIFKLKHLCCIHIKTSK